MLGLVFEGVSMAFRYWKEVLSLLLSGLGLGSACAAILYRREKADDRIMFVLLSGFLIIGLLTPFAALLGILNPAFVILFIGLGVGSIIYLIRKGTFIDWQKSEFQQNIWIPICIFMFFLMIRLAFIQQLVLPPFSDSVEHYEKIATLLALEHAQPIALEDFIPYYHWGFHALTAWVGAITGYTHPLLMAVTSHTLLAMLPVTFYFMLLAFDKKQIVPALFGALLAGMGWVMPSYAINYGKYPALMSICMVPLLLGVLSGSGDVIKQRKWDWLVFYLLLALGISWMHSRMGIFLVIYLIVNLISKFIYQKLNHAKTAMAAFFMITLIAVFIISAGRDPSSQISFDFYLGEYGAVTFLVFAILPFAIQQYAPQVIQWSLILFLLIIGTLTGLPGWSYHYPLNMFDQLFLDLILFLPLAVLGTLGMRGMVNVYLNKGQYSQYVPIFLMVIVFINGWFIQPWLPSFESNYVSADDFRVFSWIGEEAADDAQFVIASLVKTERYSRSSDSGAWINVLTGKPVLKAPYELDWNSPLLLEGLCSQGQRGSPLYVYVGHNPTSFNIPSCVAGPALIPTLCYPQARLFLLDCQFFYK